MRKAKMMSAVVVSWWRSMIEYPLADEPHRAGVLLQTEREAGWMSWCWNLDFRSRTHRRHLVPAQ